MTDLFNPSYLLGSHKNTEFEAVDIENGGFFYNF